MAKTYDLLIRAKGDTKPAQRELDGFAGRVKGFGNRVSGAMKTAMKGGVLALAAGLAVAARTGWNEFKESERIAAQTAAALKSTGGAAKVTGKQIETLAGSLSRMSGIDDELIQSGQNLLLTFTNIRNEAGKGNDVFNQSTRVMTDMSVALGQDMKTSAMQLGKALNDPAKGMTSLRRIGVTFTEQQKKQIKALTDSGQTMKAQKIILAELNREFGGSAKAMGSTTEGKIKRLKNAFDELSGKGIARVVDWISRLMSWWDKTTSKTGTLRPIIDGLKTAWDGLKRGLSAAADAFAKAFGGSDKMNTTSKQLSQSLGKMIAKLGPVAEKWLPKIGSALGTASKYAVKFGKMMYPVVQKLWGWFKKLLGIVGSVIKGIVGKLKSWWTTMKATNTRVAQMIVNAVAKFQQMRTQVAAKVQGIKDKVSSTFNTMKTSVAAKVKDLKNSAVARFNEVVTFVRNLPGRIKSAAGGMWDGIKDAFRNMINGVISLWNNLSLKMGGYSISLPGGKAFKIPSFSLETPNIPYMARGGVVNAATLAVIGERGPEAVVPLGRSAQARTDRSNVMAAAGLGGVVVNIVNQGVGNMTPQDADRLARVVANAMKNGRAGRKTATRVRTGWAT